MAKKRKQIGWPLRILAVLVLIAAIGGAWYWWDTKHWAPPLEEYPDQGVHAGADSGTVNFRTAKALGASFAYLDASSGAQARDPAFVTNLARAREADLQIGAVHQYDPCLLADGQSANFVTIVPRGRKMLPPAIALDKFAEDCEVRVPNAAVESELMTFINQVENHVGKPVILKISPAFEKRYRIAGRFERNLWLERTRFLPDYGGRPWLLWTANTELSNEASQDSLRWVVARP